MATPGNPQYPPPGPPYAPPQGNPGFGPAPRKRGAGMAITLSVVGVVAVLGAVLVGLYVTGAIGPSTDDGSEEAAPPEHEFDEELCDWIDFAAFGPELSQDGEVEVLTYPNDPGEEFQEEVHCRQYYDYSEQNPDSVVGDVRRGQVSIMLVYFPTEQKAVDYYGPSKMSPEEHDFLEDYAGSWDEGLISQFSQAGGADVTTEALFRDGNAVAYVRFYWSGGEWDTEQMTAGVQDLTEQVAGRLDH